MHPGSIIKIIVHKVPSAPQISTIVPDGKNMTS